MVAPIQDTATRPYDCDFVFQKVVDMSSDRTLYYEMLTRFASGSDTWETFFRMPMDDFMEILNHQLDYLFRNRPDFRVGINVFSSCIGNGSLESLLKGKEGVDGLFVELSEMSTELCHSSQFAKRLETLKKMGCKIVLDDFGSRFSNIDFVTRYKDYLDYIKIDGKIFIAATNNEHDAFLLAAIVNYMRYMGIEIVAEHVEDESAIRFAQRIGIEYGQGFGLGRPESLGD